MPFVKSGQYQLHYEVIAIAAPWHKNVSTVLFHHGIGANSGIWTDWVYALADRYRLLQFDMRGFGLSDVPDAQFRWSIDLLSDDVLAIADAAKASTFHFAGESIGGTIGLHSALKHPDRFASVTLSNAAHVGGSIQKVKAWRRLIDERGMAGWSDEFMKDRFHSDAIPADRYAWFARQQAAGSRDSALNALSVLIGTDLRSELPSLRAPVLLLHPDDSPFIPLSVVADLYARIPSAELQVFATPGTACRSLTGTNARRCCVDSSIGGSSRATEGNLITGRMLHARPSKERRLDSAGPSGIAANSRGCRGLAGTAAPLDSPVCGGRRQ